MTCKYNYDLICDLKFEIGPAPCDKKCCSEHQTLFARAEGLGTRSVPSGIIDKIYLRRYILSMVCPGL